jgi:ubiquinone/menaquinone biosynthesis C-methylase UbiE
VTTTQTPAFTSAEVRHYYDRNTRSFLEYGDGGSTGSIHRAVWAPGVLDRAGAFRYVEEQIAAVASECLPSSLPVHVVDLGCGVAASLCYLASRLPVATATGVTLSGIQAALARERIERAGLAGRVNCLEGDFAALPAAIASADLVFAIESFVHGSDPRAFLVEAARILRPDGLLIVCDDFLTGTVSPAAHRTLDAFRRGWHVNTLIDGAALRDLAVAASFDHLWTRDLTPWLQLGRPRDRAFRAIGPALRLLPRVSPRLANISGGAALQTALARGWIRYEFAVFQRKSFIATR